MLAPVSAAWAKSCGRRATTYRQQLSPAGTAYLRQRGISPEAAEQFHLGEVTEPLPGDEPHRGRLTIPTLTATGRVASLTFASLDGGEPKYLCDPGAGKRLYNAGVLQVAQEEIHVAEGQIDTITLAMCGLPAVGVTGTSSWKEHYPRLLAGFRIVYIWSDPDKAGDDLAEQIRQDLPGTTRRVRLTADVNDVYRAGGDEAIWEAKNGH
jgi:DNA primase